VKKRPLLTRVGRPMPSIGMPALWWADSAMSVGYGDTPEEALARWCLNLPPPLRWWVKARHGLRDLSVEIATRLIARGFVRRGGKE
jgi:hypothetical protein